MDLWGRKEAEQQEVHEYRKQGTGVGESLDALAISLADETMPRRRALRLLGAALVGSVMASIPGVAWAKPCKPGTLQCGTKCCPQEASCVRGQCVCPGAGEVICAGKCTNVLTTDLNNCGRCGHVCPSGPTATPVCQGGFCEVQPICTPASCCCSCFFAERLPGGGFGPERETCLGTLGTASIEQCDALCSAQTPLGFSHRGASRRCASPGGGTTCTPTPSGSTCAGC